MENYEITVLGNDHPLNVYYAYGIGNSKTFLTVVTYIGHNSDRKMPPKQIFEAYKFDNNSITDLYDKSVYFTGDRF